MSKSVPEDQASETTSDKVTDTEINVVIFSFRVMNSKVVKDGGGSMKSLSSGKKDSNTPHIDSGVDSGLSYRSQNSNSNSDSQCSDSASCNSTQCAQVK